MGKAMPALFPQQKRFSHFKGPKHSHILFTSMPALLNNHCPHTQLFYMVYYSPLFVDFLSAASGRIAKLLYNNYVHQRHNPAYRFLITSDKVNFITNGCFETINYLPASKADAFIAENKWPDHAMQEGKPAKIIRKLFTPRALQLLHDTDFEIFGNAYKAWFKNDMSFELLPNTDIKSVYNMPIAPGDGSLNGSCMNGQGRCMQIYNECEALRILVLKRPDGLLLGRALVWQLEDMTLMDRIYVVDDYMYQCFIAYAVRNKWWYKKNYKSYMDKQSFIDSNGQEVERNLKIYTRTNFETFPYIDTFSYGDGNSLNNYGDGPFDYMSAEGNRCGDVFDSISGIYIRGRHAVQVECGERKGEVTHRNNTVIINGQYWWEHDPALCVIN